MGLRTENIILFRAKVAGKCDNKNQCSLTANNADFGDPCRKVYKYLTVIMQVLFWLGVH